MKAGNIVGSHIETQVVCQVGSQVGSNTDSRMLERVVVSQAHMVVASGIHLVSLELVVTVGTTLTAAAEGYTQVHAGMLSLAPPMELHRWNAQRTHQESVVEMSLSGFRKPSFL